MSEDLTDVYGSEYLRSDNTELVRRAKIGTYTPRSILVHEDDMPLEEGKHFRYVKRREINEKHPGFEPEYGLVEEVRENSISSTIFVSLDGIASKVEDL